MKPDKWMTETADLWSHMLGPKSDLNIAGKVVLLPLIALVLVVWAVMGLLLYKR